MAQRIQVGNDTLEFPDTMSDADISAAIDKEYGAKGASPTPAPSSPYEDPTGWKPDTSPQRSKAVQDAYDALPWYQQIPQATGDLARLAAHGFTGGMNNRFIGDVAGAFSGDYNTTYRQREQADADARVRAGLAGTGADIVGTIGGPGKIMPAERAVQAAFPAAGNFIAKTVSRGLLGAGENVALNAANNIGQGDLPQENAGAAAAFGAGGAALATPALTRVAGALGNRIPGMTINNPVPTTGQLETAKNAAYDVVKTHAPYARSDVQQAVQDARTQMTNMRLNPKIHPGADARISDLENITDPATQAYWATGSKNPNPIDLEQERQFIRRDTSGSPGDTALGQPLINRLDDVLHNTRTTAGVLAGPDVDAARRANALYQNSSMLDNWHEQDINNPNATTVIPSNARALLKNQDERALLQPQEVAAVQGLARGGPFAKAVDFVAAHPLAGPLAIGGLTSAMTGSPMHGAMSALAYGGTSLGAKALSKVSSNTAMNTARRVLTGTAPNATPFSDAVTSGPSRDRLNALLMGLYNQPQ